MRKLLITCLAVMLWSCDTPRNYGPDSPYYRFPTGTRLVLNQAIEIPPYRATVRLQSGKTVPYGEVQEAYPYCVLEINTVSEKAQRVEPDTFTVLEVGHDITPIAAGPGFFVHAAFADVSRPGQMFYKTIFRLKSEKQPGVRQLSCQSDQFAAGVSSPDYLNVPQIRQALGSIFTLELPK